VNKKIKISTFVLITLLALSLFGWHYCTAHTVSPSRLSKLKVGMDWKTAQGIIGTKDIPTIQPDGTYFLPLRKWGRWCMVDITFDSSMQITSVFHDH